MVADIPTPTNNSTADIFENEDAYVSDLLSYSLERLNKEPELLKADSERINRSIQVVAVDHYRAFITAAQSVKSVHEEVERVDSHLGRLLEALPGLEEGCAEFVTGANRITQGRSVNRDMLSCHSSLLELLELPQLMDTCLRNGNYDETLDLQAFAAKLGVIHSGLPVVQALQKEVAGISAAMLQQLLQRLKSSIHLPECLRIIGYLRRMAVFSEREMRVTFLRCREAWFQGVVQELDQANTYEFLKRLTDAHRMHLFDVVMQFRAIFADDTSSAEESPALTTSSTSSSSASSQDSGLLYSWAMHRVSLYLHEVQRSLASISEGSVLASLLEHCMYCAMSLGRVGLDFRGLLSDIFLPQMEALVRGALTHAGAVFAQALAEHRWVALPAVTHDSMFYAGVDEASGPPYSLMEHPPVAVFTNGVLAALNELRHCAPIALRATLAQALQEALEGAVGVLMRYHATHTLQDSESALFYSLVRGFSEVCTPYLAACFARVYSSTTPAATTTAEAPASGGTTADPQALINTAAILLPLKELLMMRAASDDNLEGHEAEEASAPNAQITTTKDSVPMSTAEQQKPKQVEVPNEITPPVMSTDRPGQTAPIESKKD